jgi:hypothetical protein
MNIPCLGGGIAVLQVDNTDCSCVSITSIVNNGNGTFTINLSNGQATTLTIPAGASGTIAMRVAGGYIQYSSNGGSWINLISIASITGPTGEPGANGSALIWSDATDGSTGLTYATTGSFTTIKSGATNFNIPNSNLVTVGDCLKVYATVTSSDNTASLSSAQLVFNSTQLGAYGNGAGLFQPGTAERWLVESVMTLTDATAGAQKVRVETTWTGFLNDSAGGYSQVQKLTIIQDLSSLNFNAANQNFYLQVDQTVASTLIAKEWRCEVYHINNQTPVTVLAIGGQFANDALAAAGGIPVGGYYINSATGSITQRLS